MSTIIERIKEKYGEHAKVTTEGSKIVISRIEERVVNKEEISIYLDIENEFTQFYLGFYERLIKSKDLKIAPALLTFVLKYKISKNNEFEVNQSFYDQFADYLEALDWKRPNDRYTKRIMSQMVEKEFFFRKRQGKYQVNPLGFWKGSKDEREEAIWSLMDKGVIELGENKVSKKVRRIGKKHEDGIIG